MGHGLMENRYGLLVDACLTSADGHAERVAALHMIEPRADRPQAITLGADKAYDTEDFVNELRSMNVTPYVAQNTSGRCSAIDGRTTRHGGYVVSQRIHKRVEEAFGCIKTVAGQDKTKFRGRDRCRMGLHLRGRRLQSHATAQAAGGAGMKASAARQPIGRWRLVEADPCDRSYPGSTGHPTLKAKRDPSSTAS
jgi:Transposase DDE domain